MGDEDTTTVTLWTLAPSANSSVIRSFLSHCEIEFVEENAYGKTRTPEYMAKFPTNLAPALAHGDLYLTENVAILQYLCRAFPERCGRFYPSDERGRARCEMMLEYVSTSFCDLMCKATYPTLGFGGFPGDVMTMDSTKSFTEEAQEAATDAISDKLQHKFADIFLKDTKYLWSDSPTIADFRFAPMLTFAKTRMILPKRVQQYYDDFMALARVKAACASVVEFCSDMFVTE